MRNARTSCTSTQATKYRTICEPANGRIFLEFAFATAVNKSRIVFTCERWLWSMNEPRSNYRMPNAMPSIDLKPWLIWNGLHCIRCHFETIVIGSASRDAIDTTAFVASWSHMRCHPINISTFEMIHALSKMHKSNVKMEKKIEQQQQRQRQSISNCWNRWENRNLWSNYLECAPFAYCQWVARVLPRW